MNEQDLLNDKANIDTDSKYALEEEAGLVCVGKDEDGLLEWTGTKQQWDKFIQLEKENLE